MYEGALYALRVLRVMNEIMPLTARTLVASGSHMQSLLLEASGAFKYLVCHNNQKAAGTLSLDVVAEA